MGIELINNDVNLTDLEPESFDGLLSDPPYGIEFLGKDWDRCVPPASTWAHLAKALKPGAPLLICGGARTFHRLGVALEDAGLELRDCLMWLYGQGMPKTKGISLKPAYEPILFARKPFKGSLANNIATHGVGALNIGGCLIDRAADDTAYGWTVTGSKASANRSMSGPNQERSPIAKAGDALPGRYPSNVILDEEAAALLDASHPKTKSRPYKASKAKGKVLGLEERSAGGFNDPKSGVSRFFYKSKVSTSERGDSDHPTMKPLDLCEYLAKLILPVQNVENAKLLVPFSGSGSEILGAVQAGWKHVTGIELTESYVETAKKRLRIGA